MELPLKNGFISNYQVGDKIIQIDELLVFSELSLSGTEGEPESPTKLIASVKKAIRPPELAETLTDGEAFALAVRVSLAIKELGKGIAP